MQDWQWGSTGPRESQYAGFTLGIYRSQRITVYRIHLGDLQVPESGSIQDSPCLSLWHKESQSLRYTEKHLSLCYTLRSFIATSCDALRAPETGHCINTHYYYYSHCNSPIAAAWRQTFLCISDKPFSVAQSQNFLCNGETFLCSDERP